MELNATFGIRYGHFSSVDGGGGGGGSGHDSLRDKAEIFLTNDGSSEGRRDHDLVVLHFSSPSEGSES